MKFVKGTIVLLIMFLSLCKITFAEETKTFSSMMYDVLETEENEHISNIDNSGIFVRVFKVINGENSVIYEGDLADYDGGELVFADFTNMDCLIVMDWETLGNEIIYIVPVSKINEDKSLIITEIQNTDDLNATKTETVEQTSPISTTQLIEYDVTYSIISDESLSMDIDYNVYNGSSENDTVSLIAALYENGRLTITERRQQLLVAKRQIIHTMQEIC